MAGVAWVYLITQTPISLLHTKLSLMFIFIVKNKVTIEIFCANTVTYIFQTSVQKLITLCTNLLFKGQSN